MPAACGGQEPETPPPAEATGGSPGVIGALTREATIYFDDTKALFAAPLGWNTRQGGAAVGAGPAA